MLCYPTYMPSSQQNNARTSTGHSRALRAKLRLQRESLGLTQQQVADLIAQDLEIDGMTKGAISAYEGFLRHPSVDIMAAWCRVLGLRLLVDIDESKSSRVPVLLNPANAEVARALDMAPPEDQVMVRQMVTRLLGNNGR